MNPSDVPLPVYITAKDIREGKQSDPMHCPLSRAVRRALKRMGIVDENAILEVSVIVGVHATRWVNLSTTFEVGYWNTSNAVKDWIRDFDMGIEVKPRAFTLSPLRYPS